MRLGFILALTLLAACVSVGPRAPGSSDILDEETGNTLLVATAPLVFARSRLDVAAHARDYATLVAVEVDISGGYRDYLLLYRWSTVDKRMTAPPEPDQGQLRLMAGGRVIDLKPMDVLPVSLNHKHELHVPDHADVVAHSYEVDVATLRFMASSRDLLVQMPQERFAAPFALWEDGTKALLQFSQRAGEAPAHH